ncbi:MAG: Asp-tRNA(Asn)/Glu-tRNA(Gln) amidotransferase subunit GatC [Ruminococcus sp.]|nr:Asp-tRNA(Asn)/Glu-tRNA(Gln) amidotransferase subunit GatC [Ruminococcus sp.]
MDLEMVSYLSKLGKLTFSEDELKKMAEEMTSIIEIMDTVKEIDITYDALADNHNVYLNDLREDVSQPSMATEKILQNATQSNNCFVVPKVVE